MPFSLLVQAFLREQDRCCTSPLLPFRPSLRRTRAALAHVHLPDLTWTNARQLPIQYLSMMIITTIKHNDDSIGGCGALRMDTSACMRMPSSRYEAVSQHALLIFN
jgi:hypothetical protein